MRDGEAFLDDLPLYWSWLACIVDALKRRPGGEASLAEIFHDCENTGRSLTAKAKEAMTRSLNNYCINSGDAADRRPKNRRMPYFFERTARGVYRLLSRPSKGELLELQTVKFTDRAWQRFFDLCEIAWLCKMEFASKLDMLYFFYKLIAENERVRSLAEEHGLKNLPIKKT